MADARQASDEDLCEVVERAVALARALGCAVPVRCNPSGLTQVFLNLILNAAQAMDGQGILWIHANAIDDGVEAVVRDNGPGIADPQQIFTPFYSTKPYGTGLGLSIVRGIVREHGGRDRCLLDGCQGATFRIQLPKAPLECG